MKRNKLKGILFAGLLALIAFAPSVGRSDFLHANKGYVEINLISDVASNAHFTDSRLVNPWGIVAGPAALWINDNGLGLITAYGAFGFPLKFAINVPAPDGTNAGTPTGLIFNDTDDFVITNGTNSEESTLLAATEDGTIVAWNRHLTGTNAIIVVDNSASGAVYKGLAIARLTNGTPQLYAANFHSGVVDVFDGNFQHIQSFTDTNLPAGFAPFNIKKIRGELYVTFALQDADAHDDVSGPGNGFVDVFDPDGTLLSRFASQGALNSPWGLALAPDNFGHFSHALLVGNFGDGKINAYNLSTGEWLGNLTKPNGDDVVIDGLWGLDFPPFDRNHGHARLFFTSGPNGEADGLVGYLHAVGPPEFR